MCAVFALVCLAMPAFISSGFAASIAIDPKSKVPGVVSPDNHQHCDSETTAADDDTNKGGAQPTKQDADSGDDQSDNADQKDDADQNEGVTVFLTTHYMDEADRVANRIAVIDHGKIVAMGSSAELKAQTEKETLEDAFLVLTGAGIRDEAAGSAEQMRQVAKMWGRR